MTTMLDRLGHAELEIVGRITPASNQTYLARLDGLAVVYKPIAGERPLWDFPDGTLAHREVAAFWVSEYAGWHLVPETVLRPGPLGVGMVQRWVGPDPLEESSPEDDSVLDLLPAGPVPAGWLHVLDASDAVGERVQLVHRDLPGLRRLALFDVVTNNTDRKGGHTILDSDGRIWGVDHGLCFHSDDKLRTVLWGWAGAGLSAEEIDDLTRLLAACAPGAALEVALRELLSPTEVEALRERCRRVLAAAELPRPGHGPGAGDRDWPAIPWPPF